jgi:PAS domain S-box-containing protein
MTDSIDAEKEIKGLNERYKGIFDATNNGMAVFSATGDGTDFIFVDLNSAFEKIERIDRKSAIGKAITEIFPSVKDLGFFNALQRVWETGQPVDLPTFKYNDGRISGWRKNYVYKLPTGEIVSLYRDETHQKSIQLALRQSYENLELEMGATTRTLNATNENLTREIHEREKIEAQLGKSNLEWQTTFDAVDSAMCLLDKDGNLLKANKAMAEMLQKPIANILGEPFCRLVHGTKMPINNCPFVQMKKTLKRETVKFCVDQRWLEVAVSPIVDMRGALAGAVHIISDVTARTEAEMALKNRKEHLPKVLDSIRAGILIIDRYSHKIIDVNQHAAQLIGLAKEDILSRNCHDFLSPTSEEQCPISGLGQSVNNAEKIMVTADGKHIPVLKSVVIGQYLGKTALIESFVEISKQKEAEDVQRETDRLRGVFEMAGAVCHELNQPLMAMSGYLELLSMEMSDNPAIIGRVNKVNSQFRRISEITGKLMTITRYETKKYLRDNIVDIDKSSALN